MEIRFYLLVKGAPIGTKFCIFLNMDMYLGIPLDLDVHINIVQPICVPFSSFFPFPT